MARLALSRRRPPRRFEGSLDPGEKGSVEIAGFAVNQIRHWAFVDEPSDKDVMEKFSVNPPNVYALGHQAYYQHVVDCLIHQHAALVDGLEGRKAGTDLAHMNRSKPARSRCVLRPG